MNDTGPPKPERSQGVSFYLGVAQFGRAGGLGPSGRRFDPCHLDHVFVAQLVLEHLTFNEGVTGSNPVGDTKI